MKHQHSPFYYIGALVLEAMTRGLQVVAFITVVLLITEMLQP
jgi:hypothetical protein